MKNEYDFNGIKQMKEKVEVVKQDLLFYWE